MSSSILHALETTTSAYMEWTRNLLSI